MLSYVRHILFALVLAAGFATPTEAQFVNNPGTGCAGAIATTGTPTIGTTPTVSSPCPPGTVCALIIGTPIPCIAFPPLCPGCSLCCQPLAVVLFVTPASVALPIPNNSALIGATGCMQMACMTSSGCFKTSDSLSFTIQ